VEITGFCDMEGSKITHLSPLLHFTGRDEQGRTANFFHCEALTVAEGNFIGFVGFVSCSIQRIGKLTITAPSHGGMAAHFNDCKFLEVAEGVFPGYVRFNKCGIVKIGELTTEVNKAGAAASFRACEKLKVAEGTFPGHVDFSGSGIEEIGDLKFAGTNPKKKTADFRGCRRLRKIPIKFNINSIEADEPLLRLMRQDHAGKERLRPKKLAPGEIEMEL